MKSLSFLNAGKHSLRSGMFFLFFTLCLFTAKSQITMMNGTYIGDGTDDRVINGAGFQPAVVIVKQIDGVNEGQIRTANMGAGLSKQMVGNALPYTDRIQSFTSNGFVVGANNDVNKLGKTYYWTAFKASSGIAMGSYTGTQSEPVNITGVGFDPVLVLIIPTNDHKIAWRSSAFTGDRASYFGSSSSLDHTILNLIPDGFQIGNSIRSNKLGDTYLYLAFKASSGIKVGKYIGNGIDPTTITGVGFKAKYLFIKSDAGNRAVQKSDIMPDPTTVEFDNSRADDNRIHGLNNDGFIIGKQGQVNDKDNDYFYVAFTNSPELLPSVPCIVNGSYVGDGSSNRAIGGLPFQPDVLIVKGDWGQEAQIRTTNMPDGYSKQLVGGSDIYLSRIQSFNPDGFVIGNNPDVNKAGKTYYYTAFQSGGGKLVTGLYDGDNVAGRTIGGVGFQPELVFVLPDASNRASWRSSSFGSNSASAFGSDPSLANTITGFAADGFIVGNDVRANKLGKSYYYVAFEASADYLKVGSYTGDGIDNKVISGVGFMPEYMFIKSGGHNAATQKSSVMDVDVSIEFSGSKSDDNRIHSLNGDGFVLGTQGQVNSKNQTYYYVAFKGCGGTVKPVYARVANANKTTAADNIEIARPGADHSVTLPISVFPNPVRTAFSLRVGASKQEAGLITITDFNGKTVYSSTVSIKVGDNVIPVNTSNLAPGMYLVKLSRGGNVQSVKIVVSR